MQQGFLALDSSEPKKTRNNLGTLNGCYIPCLLNILGAVLFLRVGFAIGTMGMLGALGIFAFAELIAYLTITSFSAIVTNGMMEGGGAYYMISRNLGPAFGGSSGLLFWFTYCINVTFNTVAFTGTIQPVIFPDGSWWASGDYLSSVTISTITLFVLFLVAYKGAGAFAKVNYFIFFALVVACAVSIGSLFFNNSTKHLDHWTNTENVDIYYNASFSKFSMDTLRDNLYPKSVSTEQCEQAAAFGSANKAGQVCTLQLVFSIVFPAVVGMMEGANLSGDLKDPAYSIPVGTLAAVSTAFVCYILLIIGQAGTVSREALQFDMNVMQHATVGDGYFVITGVTAACLSTALGSMFGSARILQAIAKDQIFPALSFFAKGTTKGDEPRRGVVLSYAVAQAGIFLGNLDDVAPILTNFFLCTYCLVNLACFLLQVANCPNFRPTYRVFSWPSSLAGALLIIVVMFYLQWIYALITLAIVLLIYLYISFCFKGHAGWINISQALMFRMARACLLKISSAQREELKFWRPNMLMLAVGSHVGSTVQHLDQMKQSGLLVLGLPLRALAPELSEVEAAKEALDATTGARQVFTQVAIGGTAREACRNLLLNAGLGVMRPNILALPLGGSGKLDEEEATVLCQMSAEEYVSVMSDARAMKKSLLLTSHNAREVDGANHVDIWIFGEIGSPDLDQVTQDELQLSLVLQLAYLDMRSQKSAAGQPVELRVFALAPETHSNGENQELILQKWLHRARIPAEVSVVEPTSQAAPVRTSGDWEWLAEKACVGAVRAHMCAVSTKTRSVHMLLRHFDDSSVTAQEYMAQLVELTQGLPSCVMACNCEGQPVITTAI